MEYIKPCDYEYIMNKYHPNGDRFKRWDIIFDEKTGMDGDEIKRQILIRDEKMSHLSHPVRKAEAFRFVLENTRISCDSRDIFPAINAIDRPLNATVIDKWEREVFEEIIPETEKLRAEFEEKGIATMWPDYDHSVPVWKRVFELGFAGLLEESEAYRKTVSETKEQDDFFEGIKITYSAIISFVERLEKLAKETKDSEKMAKALENIKTNPPKTFYEGLLVMYIYFMLSEHIEGLQVRSLSGFDNLFFSLFQNDLKKGVTEDEIRTDLAYFFLQFTSIANYWNQPVYLGGCKEDESTIINPLSYLFLDVYDKMGIYNPKIHIKVSRETPKEFLQKALDMIRRGHNCIVFLGDPLVRKALENKGVSKDKAREANITGCYEYSPQGSYGTGMNYVNLVKPLEYTLCKGCDGVTGEFSGRKSPDVKDYKTFEEFYEEYKNQLTYVLDIIVKVVNEYEEYLSYVNPQSMLSATFPSCLENGKDVLSGGAERNNSSIACGFIANVADSLTIIKKYVFDKKEISLEKLVEVLKANYAGEELLRRKFLSDRNKYGNNKELPDFFASDIANFISGYVEDKPNNKKRGGKWGCGFHVARMSYTQGEVTMALPDGRLKGEELSKNCSASMGQNREGATAAILSVTKIDATKFVGDACLDLGLLPSAVSGDDGLEAMYGLLMTFVNRMGHAMHINVFDADTLRDAQAHPEKYEDLQIRVCGWNVLWNNICKVEQDGFIKQAENLI